MPSIYIVFSSTPHYIGKMIRCCTGEKYNHISIALDKDLQKMYSFARRYYRTPLWGGFVKETLHRYHIKGKTAQICQYEIPVTQAQYEALESKLTTMQKQAEKYLYNHISALSSLFGKSVTVKNAYTCVEFCAEILKNTDVALDPKKHYSLKDIQAHLAPYLIYTGPMPAPKDRDTNFYAKLPVLPSIWATFRDMLRLLPRL